MHAGSLLQVPRFAEIQPSDTLHALNMLVRISAKLFCLGVVCVGDSP